MYTGKNPLHSLSIIAAAFRNLTEEWSHFLFMLTSTGTVKGDG